MSTTRESLLEDIKDFEKEALVAIRRINRMNAELDDYTGTTREDLELDLMGHHFHLHRAMTKMDEAYAALITLDAEKPSLLKRIFRK